ncbi:MAG: hypothetical protein LBG79_01120 [Spirochaetaceae bacterium]|nr:hypothetical protein [Spirochaetaceae bacterium]
MKSACFLRCCILFELFFFCLLAVPLFGADPFLEQEDTVLDGQNASSKPVLNEFIDSLLRQPGFGIYADYSILGAYYPGWSYSPWDGEFKGDEAFRGNQPLGAEMRGKISFDIRISPELRVWQSVKFFIPDMKLDFAEFYADYIFLDHVFFKIGKYDYHWGFNYANYRYTDLISLIPDIYENPGELYIAKAVAPIAMFGTNICDIEFLGFTRTGFVNTSSPELEQFAFGLKLNFAQRWADIDIGTVYFKLMPLRYFISVKTTLFSRTEIYAEAMATTKIEENNETTFSASFGFYNDFFKKKLRINAEFFWNGEKNVKTLVPENPLEDEKQIVQLFIPGPNIALNIDFRTGIFFNLRFGLQFRYSVFDNSGQIIPGITVEPARHLRIYFATPLVVGSRSEEPYSYYKSNDDKYNRPFSFVIAVSISGSWEFTRYK